MEGQKVRKRRSVGQHKTENRSMFRLYNSRSKNLLIYFCLFQGIAVITFGTYIITYHPWLLEDGPAVDITPNARSEETVEDKNGYTNKLSKITEEIKTDDGEAYSVFRFDKFRNGRERPLMNAMVNESGEYVYFSKTKEYFPEDEPIWVEQKEEYEPGRFEVYGGRVVHMKGVQINPSLGSGRAGGEEIDEVVNQNVDVEYLTLQKGYFMYKTKEPFTFKLPVSVDLHKMEEGLLIEKQLQTRKEIKTNTRNKVAIVTIRHEYANFYHCTMNWYDVFLIMVILKIDPNVAEIVWLDAHPKSKLDDAWVSLYGKPIRASSLTKPINYEAMVWNGIGARSQINAHKLQDLPFVNEFRHFVLRRFAIMDDHKLDCGDIRVTLIWRRDNVAHPRNPSGFVSRKIANEEELWKGLKGATDSLVVNGVQLDELSMHEQLKLIAKTDILIGMHGAGLSHILYLPRTSGVIELYPNYFSPSHAHFRSMTKWRRMPYMMWANNDKSKDSKDHKTIISVNALKDMVNRMTSIICEKVNAREKN